MRVIRNDYKLCPPGGVSTPSPKPIFRDERINKNVSAGAVFSFSSGPRRHSVRRKVMLPILRMLAGFFPLLPVTACLFPCLVSWFQHSQQGSSQTASPARGLTWTTEWMEKGRKAWALLRMLRTVRVTKAFSASMAFSSATRVWTANTTSATWVRQVPQAVTISG